MDDTKEDTDDDYDYAAMHIKGQQDDETAQMDARVTDLPLDLTPTTQPTTHPFGQPVPPVDPTLDPTPNTQPTVQPFDQPVPQADPTLITQLTDQAANTETDAFISAIGRFQQLNNEHIQRQLLAFKNETQRIVYDNAIEIVDANADKSDILNAIKQAKLSALNDPATSPGADINASDVNDPATSPVAINASDVNDPATSPVAGTDTTDVTSPATLPGADINASDVNDPATSPVAGTDTTDVTSPATSPVAGTDTSDVNTTVSGVTDNPPSEGGRRRPRVQRKTRRRGQPRKSSFKKRQGH